MFASPLAPPSCLCRRPHTVLLRVCVSLVGRWPLPNKGPLEGSEGRGARRYRTESPQLSFWWTASRLSVFPASPPRVRRTRGEHKMTTTSQKGVPNSAFSDKRPTGCGGWGSLTLVLPPQVPVPSEFYDRCRHFFCKCPRSAVVLASAVVAEEHRPRGHPQPQPCVSSTLFRDTKLEFYVSCPRHKIIGFFPPF